MFKLLDILFVIKLKSEILFKQKYFSVITKNSNWEILLTNLVNFKRYDRIEDAKMESLKNLTFRGESQETNIEGGGGGVGQFADLRGLGKEKAAAAGGRGGV